MLIKSNYISIGLQKRSKWESNITIQDYLVIQVQGSKCNLSSSNQIL